jgi:HAD superfamily hydrolase (TIGR01509 family)
VSIGDDASMTSPEVSDTAPPLDPLAFDAVLFDMDGTLVDSEPIWFEVLRAVVSEYGGDLPEDAHGALHGSDRATTTVILRERFGLQGDAQAFWSRVVERLTVELAHAPAMPNAGAWVEAVAAAGRARAVVSNSPRAMVEASLAPHAWARHLEVRVAIDDVERGKPRPDSYLLAAGRLGVDARRCLIVEDSEAGAKAAVAAGATCLFVTNGVVDPARARTITPHVVAALPALASAPG